MYSEEVCWDSFRFHKADMPYLAGELGLANASPDFADGLLHTPEGYKLEPMEAPSSPCSRVSHTRETAARAAAGRRRAAAAGQPHIRRGQPAVRRQGRAHGQGVR